LSIVDRRSHEARKMRGHVGAAVARRRAEERRLEAYALPPTPGSRSPYRNPEAVRHADVIAAMRTVKLSPKALARRARREREREELDDLLAKAKGPDVYAEAA
jgi:hypothetical protein